jgi:hypothetical protein
VADLYACAKCGAVVFDRERHGKWHWVLTETVQADEWMAEEDEPPHDSHNAWMPSIDKV